MSSWAPVQAATGLSQGCLNGMLYPPRLPPPGLPPGPQAQDRRREEATSLLPRLSGLPALGIHPPCPPTPTPRRLSRSPGNRHRGEARVKQDLQETAGQLFVEQGGGCAKLGRGSHPQGPQPLSPSGVEEWPGFWNRGSGKADPEDRESAPAHTPLPPSGSSPECALTCCVPGSPPPPRSLPLHTPLAPLLAETLSPVPSP